MLIPHCAAIDNLILIAGRCHRIRNSAAAIISTLDSLNRFLHPGIGNIRIIIAKAALDNTVDIDVGRVDVNITTGNIAAIRLASRAVIHRAQVKRAVLAFTDDLLIFVIVQILRRAADFHDAIGITLRYAALRRLQRHCGTTHRHRVTGVLALNRNAVALALDSNLAVFRINVALNDNVRHWPCRADNLLAGILRISVGIVHPMAVIQALHVNLSSLPCSCLDSRERRAVAFIDSVQLLIKVRRLRPGNFVAVKEQLAACFAHSEPVDFQHKVRVVNNADFRRSLRLHRTAAHKVISFNGYVAAGSSQLRNLYIINVHRRIENVNLLAVLRFFL